MFVRPLEARDRAQWEPLWQGYLEFYEKPLSREVTEHTWSMLMSDTGHAGFAAVESERVIGVAHYLVHPSTWSIGGYCYLEDLFVAPNARGKGAGRLLIEAVYKIADEKGCTRIYWNTQATNTRARALYDKVAKVSEFVQYRRQ